MSELFEKSYPIAGGRFVSGEVVGERIANNLRDVRTFRFKSSTGSEFQIDANAPNQGLKVVPSQEGHHNPSAVLKEVRELLNNDRFILDQLKSNKSLTYGSIERFSGHIDRELAARAGPGQGHKP